MLKRRQFYIDGKWTDPVAHNDFEVINPSNEEVCAIISLGDQADTDAAVAAAKAAFSGWAMTSPMERLSYVERVQDAYIARLDDLANAMSLEMGAPIDMSLEDQVGAGTSHIEDFISVAKSFAFDRPLSEGAPNTRIFYEPVGVCGLITPWNWPMNQITPKVIPALLAGCTMVLKPSEIAPLSSMVFAEIIHEAGIPPGVFNLVNGDGAGVGSQLSRHEDVAMISFTGSTRAGKLISKSAADTLKRVHLELGGKGANIIFADAAEGTVERGVADCMENSGQSCDAPTRMLVQEDIYDEAVAAAKAAALETKVGPASEKGEHIGPVVSQVHYEKIQDLIQKGIDEGARLIAGGPGKPDGFERGYFVRPTVFADVRNDMTIAQEEIFGPVLSIIPFKTEDDAIKIANDTPYGLKNYVHSSDQARVKRVASQLRSGMVKTNRAGFGSASPFGGMKASGIGREGGVWGLEDFMEVKVISGWGE